MKVDSGVVQAKSSGASATTVDQREGGTEMVRTTLEEGSWGRRGKKGGGWWRGVGDWGWDSGVLHAAATDVGASHGRVPGWRFQPAGA
jgi:hypothetical protein